MGGIRSMGHRDVESCQFIVGSNMMRRSFLVVVLLCWAWLTGPAPSKAFQERQSPIFRIDVEMVLLNVAVTDRHGNYVTGLKPGDFQVYEDGIEQTLATFAEGTEIPRNVDEFAAGDRQPRLVRPSFGKASGGFQNPQASPETRPPVAEASVFILFDTSNYMYQSFVYAQDAILDFVRSLDTADRIAFYAFSRDTKRVATISTDRQRVLHAIRRTVAGDDVALYNALLLTLRDAAQLSGRKMVVVFSNGPDNASVVAPEDVRELAQAAGIPIYMISTQEAKRDPVSTAVFERMTASTGGKAYFANSWRQQQKAFTSIREDLAHLYTLSYYPQPNPNRGWRKITVKLVGDNLKSFHTRTRVGYRPKPGHSSGQIPLASR